MLNRIISKLFRSSKSEAVYCQIKPAKSDQWLHGMIFNMDEENMQLEAFIRLDYLDKSFWDKEPVVIRYRKSNREYYLEGVVLDKILSGEKQALIIEIKDMQSYENNRKFERFNYFCSAEIIDESGRSMGARLVDISEAFVSLCSNETILPGDAEYQIQLAAFPDKLINLSGTLVRNERIKDMNHYVIKIGEIDDDNSAKLHELLVFLVMQKNEMTTEWQKYKHLTGNTEGLTKSEE